MGFPLFRTERVSEQLKPPVWARTPPCEYFAIRHLGEPTATRSAVFLNIVQKAPRFEHHVAIFFLMDFLKSA